MSTPDDALRLLGSLGDADRRWILERLPISARARLAEHVDELRDETSSPTVGPAADEPSFSAFAGSEDFEWGRSVEQLRAANPDSLTYALQSEPAWLVDALLHAAEWPWAREVRKSLPAEVRAELAVVEREGVRLGKPATHALVRELANRSTEWPPAPAPSSRLSMLVNRLRRGVRR